MAWWIAVSTKELRLILKGQIFFLFIVRDFKVMDIAVYAVHLLMD